MCIVSTPYDDVFRTLLTDCRNLIIPVVNEIFREDYTGREQVILKENEIFLRRQHGEEEKKVTDSSFAIEEDNALKKYHLECQSSADGSMVIRMYEYDSQIALKDSTLENGMLHVNFPRSAVLYLRHNKNTPDVLAICIHTPGGSVSYDVPALKVQMYSIDEIFRKKLLFLIPFYIFVFEEQFKEIEEDSVKLFHLREIYESITEKLESLCIGGELDEYTRQTICEMSEKVLGNIAWKYENIKKEVGKVMGGQVLEYEAKNILRQGIKQGIEQGIEQGVADSAQKMLAKGYSCEHVSDILELAIEEVRKIRERMLQTV
ncbi:MAG: hypothetical protein NC305_09665 [Lachnospiraceae bacterium]|nr:hypothetical protein [Butyrivibrio sp.]MCM1343612.1 hypothetical protein [Muribaculaceae bacterium]MCM1410798.1 hypothetical protein [Lachnospiraceae bacterium]